MKIHKEAFMPNKDWIPRKEQDLVDLMGKWDLWLADTDKKTAFGWDTPTCAQVVLKIGAFLNARNEYQANDSSVNLLAKDEAKEEAVDYIRDFANSSIRYNKKMTDSDKLFLGIHPKDPTHTPHPAPTSQPETVVENTTNHYEHRLTALHHETRTASKPDDAYGVRYAWQVGGEKPASGADLPHSKFSRKTSIVITHSEADKSKTAYYAACYENSKGDQGTWSPVEEAVIG
jgi:hypothetical protein